MATRLWFARLSLLLSLVILTGAAPSQTAQESYLAQSALQEILDRGTPILGTNTGCSPKAKTCNWMAKFPDNTKLVHMNLPGTHDASTWNYTDARQAELERYTGPIPPAIQFRCQEHSLYQMLNEGIRVFDLRIAYNPGNDTVGLHHSQALLAPHTRIEDVLFGFYHWLDRHPTETALISLKYESGTGTPNDVKLQQHVYDMLNSPLSKRYWVQRSGELGTLGEARGKLVLLQRHDYALLDPASTPHRIGIDLGPDRWTDNGKSIELVYNAQKNHIAYIEDFYNIVLPANATPADHIQAKFDAVTTHLTNATRNDLHPDQLFISFVSAAFVTSTPPMSPTLYAIGDSGVQALNQLLLPWLRERKGKRFGIIMLDFYDAVSGLVEAAIGL